MSENNYYTVTVYGDEYQYTDLDKALEKAKDADYRYARGFVQVHDSNGNMIYGVER